MKIRFFKSNRALNVSTTAMFLALGILTPTVFHAVGLGSEFSPMHIPVILAGMICGPVCGLATGLATPLLSSLISGMPPIFPTAVAMALELAAYGFVSGLFMSLLGNVRIKWVRNFSIVFSLLIAMLAGRMIFGVAMWIFTAFQGGTYTFALFIAGTLLNTWPAWVLQLIAVPAVMYILKNARILEKYDMLPVYVPIEEKGEESASKKDPCEMETKENNS